MMRVILDPRFFPTILIVLDVAASMSCLASHDFRRAVYWFAAAVLTCCVTY